LWKREDGTYVLTYTQWNRATYSVGIATSRDLMHWTKYGPAFLTAAAGKYAQLKYKSAGIVTRVVKDRLIAARINGMYWMYWGEGADPSRYVRRPDSLDACGGPTRRAGGVAAAARPGHFDSTFPETGPPPVLTSAGIVVLYNGKNATSGGDPNLGPNAYAAGEALFDPINPMHLLTQTEEPVLKPELPYEKTGQYAAGTTFAEGLVYFRKQWFLYYGCADSLVAAATAPAAPNVESHAYDMPAERGRRRTCKPQPHRSRVRCGQQRASISGPETRWCSTATALPSKTSTTSLSSCTRRRGFQRCGFGSFGAGVGGDRVTGGSGGPIDQRLERDVFSENPTVVTVMLGMNDGGYRATTPDIESSYTKGYEHLLQSIRDHEPGARITLLGPSPYDDVNGTPTFPGGYNSVMQHFGELDNALAQKFGGTFVDLNPSVVTALQKAKALDPRIAKLLLPDRVHPDPLAHWVMAEALLKGWNAPALVSAVTIDAHAGKVTEAQNATVDHLEMNQASLRWT
jgi:lysophospholipase L1-like esterase